MARALARNTQRGTRPVSVQLSWFLSHDTEPATSGAYHHIRKYAITIRRRPVRVMVLGATLRGVNCQGEFLEFGVGLGLGEVVRCQSGDWVGYEMCHNPNFFLQC